MLVPSLLFGISASLDALLVGVSYGIRGIRIRLWQNLVISSVTLLGTCLSVGLGRRLALCLPDVAGACAGSLILIFLGVYYIGKWGRVRWRKRCRTGTQKCDTQETASVSAEESLPQLLPAEVFTLSLTLSLNNLSAGLSASLAGLTLLPTAAATLVCSVLFLFSGSQLGGRPILQLAGRAADPLSGALLIGLGLLQLLL